MAIELWSIVVEYLPSAWENIQTAYKIPTQVFFTMGQCHYETIIKSETNRIKLYYCKKTPGFHPYHYSTFINKKTFISDIFSIINYLKIRPYLIFLLEELLKKIPLIKIIDRL